mmetsp:Transcript_12968/g.1987  ORF Transcript_12968/g.1987 Transcript_12968/m.1987 type:complete len:91 (+) Transcript_12968:365-637(+)
MVEMKEVVHVLSNATTKSLILIDEMGRGTSTNEGVSLSREITIRLADLGIFTLFATHFTELTKIQHERIKNFNTSVNLTESAIKMKYIIE